MSLKNNLSTHLKQLRLLRRMTICEFSESIGIGKSSLQNMEAGRCNPRLDTVDLIENNLNLEEGSLLSPDANARPLPPLNHPQLLLASIPALCKLKREKRPRAYTLISEIIDLYEEDEYHDTDS